MHRTILAISLALALGWPLLADKPKPIELTIHARAIESPILKYRLLPLEAELKPGNAATILLRLPWEETAYMKEVYPTLKEWDSRPLTDPKWEKPPEFLPFYDEMKRAAFRREASWEYPIGEQPAAFILLPDVQGLRTLLGYGLSAEIRHSLSQGELDQAREEILVGLANGRHIAQTPFLVNQLVAAAIARAMLDRTAELIAKRDSPNLYWALSTLPESLVELHRAASLELSMFAMTFPAANELDQPREPAEWKKMSVQLVEVLNGFGESRPRDPNQAEACRTELVQVARAELASVLQVPAEKVAAMSDDEVVVRWYVRVRANFDQTACAILCLPPREAWPRLKSLQAEIKSVQEKCKLNQLFFFEPTSSYLAIWALKRRVEALRIVEAVRDYLAAHEGKLPASLADISSLPIPRDPLTDEPFDWQVDGKTATLKAWFLPTEPQKDNPTDHRVNYQLRVE